jgi:hypothetical protein
MLPVVTLTLRKHRAKWKSGLVDAAAYSEFAFLRLARQRDARQYKVRTLSHKYRQINTDAVVYS